MASAAAVAVDEARSPSVIGEDHEESNGVTSTIAPKDPEDPKTAEEEEDDAVQRRQRRNNALQAQDDEDEGGVGNDDLFGEDEGDELPEDPVAARRELDDRDLDSGDDEGRTDRAGEAGEAAGEEMEEREIPMMDLEIPRQAGPEPSDGETYLLKIPSFMGLDPRAWKPATFQPPSTDHHTKIPAPTFSPFNTAMTTLRWRRSPSSPSTLQSNARILRWSDGSLTLQLASDPTTQYEIAGNALAPPQRNPLKPTPTSISTSNPNKNSGRRGANPASTIPGEQKYDNAKDALTYLLHPMPASESLRVSHKLTAGLTIKQSAHVVDDAIEKLQAGLAAATNATKVGGPEGSFLREVEEDPELAKKKAEIAEREKARARKRVEAQQERERDRAGRVLGRSGLGSSRFGGGLSAGMLEDEEGGAMPSSRGRKQGGQRKARPRKANSEYSSEEDYGRKGFRAQDEYDQEDGFLAPSDEEEEEAEDDEEEEEEDVDDGIREGTPKRGRANVEAGDEDAAGEVDDEPEVAAAGRKRRKVVMDDEDEE